MNRAPYARKENFWSKQRVEKKLTIKEVSDLINCDEKRTAAYFSGYLIPDEQTVRQLCELFDVDYHTGNLEFQHAHREWKAEHYTSVKYSARKKKGKIETAEDVLEALYGTLSCAEFIDIYNAIIGNASEKVNPMKILYNKVDYDTYNTITEIIKGVNTRHEEQ